MLIVGEIKNVEVEVSEFDPKIPDKYDIRIGDAYLPNMSEEEWGIIREFIENSINFIKINNERKSTTFVESDGQE